MTRPTNASELTSDNSKRQNSAMKGKRRLITTKIAGQACKVLYLRKTEMSNIRSKKRRRGVSLSTRKALLTNLTNLCLHIAFCCLHH